MCGVVGALSSLRALLLPGCRSLTDKTLQVSREGESVYREEESGYTGGIKDQQRNQGRVRRAQREDKASITPHICTENAREEDHSALLPAVRMQYHRERRNQDR